MESHLATSQYARLLAQYPNFKEYIEMVAKLRATATMHGAGRVAGQMASPGEAMGASVKGNDSFQQHRHHYADETRSLGQLFEVLNPHARQMHRKSALVRGQDKAPRATFAPSVTTTVTFSAGSSACSSGERR